MTIASVTHLVETLRESALLGRAQMEEIVHDLQGRFTAPRALARELLHRNWLTPYQINRLFLGRGGDLLLGPYVLLERLGEGGMGQVFKARHRKLDRVVALKVIRPERLINPEAVRRFFREVQAAAKLSHPNIVLAYDADEVAGTYFFAMEYVPGQDLGRVVKQNGPLPVMAACDYVRQAALGLQHAFEKGLVHRDIKPSNLLLAASKTNGLHAAGPGPNVTGMVVKILDMGLARISGPLDSDDSRTLTQVQSVLGTPDFIAPEQARNARAADIRSDLYSLGCTFYFLLTGEVPFPSGSPMEKLLKHYLEEAVPVEQRRPEVPAAVCAVVRRLMAKAPQERYQTPGELADALALLLSAGVPVAARVPLATPIAAAPAVPPPPCAEPDPPAVDSTPTDPPLSETVSEIALGPDVTDGKTVPSRPAGPRRRQPRRRRRLLAPFVVVGSIVLTLVALLIYLLVRYGT